MRLIITRVDSREVFGIDTGVRGNGHVFEPALRRLVDRTGTWTVVATRVSHACVETLLDGIDLACFQNMVSCSHIGIVQTVEACAICSLTSSLNWMNSITIPLFWIRQGLRSDAGWACIQAV
jgi:hypothetical protein